MTVICHCTVSFLVKPTMSSHPKILEQALSLEPNSKFALGQDFDIRSTIDIVFTSTPLMSEHQGEMYLRLYVVGVQVGATYNISVHELEGNGGEYIQQQTCSFRITGEGHKNEVGVRLKLTDDMKEIFRLIVTIYELRSELETLVASKEGNFSVVRTYPFLPHSLSLNTISNSQNWAHLSQARASTAFLDVCKPCTEGANQEKDGISEKDRGTSTNDNFCQHAIELSMSFVDVSPFLCTHDPATDWISFALHENGIYYTIQDLDVLCASDMIECSSNRTFVDCGAAMGHLTVLAAAMRMTGCDPEIALVPAPSRPGRTCV